jgi:prophage antirepressor-like protein
MVERKKKLLFTKEDVCNMLGVSKRDLRYAAETAKCTVLDYKNRYQRLNDGEVFTIIRTLKKRLSDTEIDSIIENY